MSSINPNDNSLTTYQFKGIYGTTDLWAEDPWLTDYGNWPTFSAHFGVTRAEYDLDKSGYANRVRTHNEAYTSELKAAGTYGKNYTVELAMKHNPLFDKPANNYPEPRPMESYRMVFLDSSEFDGESNIKHV